MPWYPQDFGKSVSHISTRRGGGIIPPDYYWPPRILRPSYGPVMVKRTATILSLLLLPATLVCLLSRRQKALVSERLWCRRRGVDGGALCSGGKLSGGGRGAPPLSNTKLRNKDPLFDLPTTLWF